MSEQDQTIDGGTLSGKQTIAELLMSVLPGMHRNDADTVELTCDIVVGENRVRVNFELTLIGAQVLDGAKP